ncbi:MAG TPA: FKBP-type peptidyl-prolyl cis-trans isomerase [Solirubrobacteraceae bacterium]|jgi:peptidylprolyl isomerase|nr:FKBP-type peptidyl-prolyl cis-trans isomerase [Solirubrobacteraceae bacterium]
MNINYIDSLQLPGRGRLGLALATLGAAAMIAGCGGSSESSTITVGNESDTNSVPHVSGEKTPTSSTPTTSTSTVKTPTSGPLASKPAVTVPSGAAPTKLVTKELIVGTGPEAKAGDSVTVNYVGVLYKGGAEFDSSWKRSEPFTFALGKGQVIPGWDQGVAGMKVGGRRELIIPAELAYGKRGSPPTIPPSAPLVFVVDLLGV